MRSKAWRSCGHVVPARERVSQGAAAKRSGVPGQVSTPVSSWSTATAASSGSHDNSDVVPPESDHADDQRPVRLQPQVPRGAGQLDQQVHCADRAFVRCQRAGMGMDQRTRRCKVG